MSVGIELSDLWKVRTNNDYLIGNVCRLCVNVSDNVLPIFDNDHGKGNIYKKLKKCLPSILVLENDTKPKQICQSCASKLDICVSFIEMSHDADFRFETALQGRLIPDIQIIDNRLTNCTKPSSSTVDELNLEEAYSKETKNQPKAPHSLNLSTTFQAESNAQQNSIIQAASNTTPFPAQKKDIIDILNKQETNRMLQSIIIHEGIPSQDLVIVVEVKNKDDSGEVLPVNSRSKTSQTEMNETYSKIPVIDVNGTQCLNVESDGTIKIINSLNLSSKLHSFDGGDTILSQTNTSHDRNVNVTSCSSILKTFELDCSTTKNDHLYSCSNITSIEGKETNKNVTNATSLPTSHTPLELTRKNLQQSRNFGCNVCGKNYTRRNRLNNHLARHTSDRPYLCDKCDRRFITRRDLTLHLRIHDGIFSCEFCGKAFPAKGKLERHQKTHTGERPFPCTFCGKAFREKRNLVSHLKTHTSKKILKNVYLKCGHLGYVDTCDQRRVCETCHNETSASSVSSFNSASETADCQLTEKTIVVSNGEVTKSETNICDISNK